MNSIRTRKARFTHGRADSLAEAARDAFRAAKETYDDAFRTIEAHTKRANHRLVIATAHTDPHADAFYGEAIATFCDPADFAPYTEAELDAHSAAIDALTAAFDRLTTAFACLKAGDHLYGPAAAFYTASCETYVFAANAYSHAVDCAMTGALGDDFPAVKDQRGLGLLDDEAGDPTRADAAAAKARAATLKTKAADCAPKAKALKEKARLGKAKADALHASRRS
jgi:hypothetical protein